MVRAVAQAMNRSMACLLASLGFAACSSPVNDSARSTNQTARVCDQALFCDGFEDDAMGQLPAAPWSEETYRSGAVIKVSDERVFSGSRSLHVLAPANARRRGYVAIHGTPVFPAASRGMYGRAMFWLDAAPIAANGSDSVHWTLLQGEGRSADDRNNAIFRLGGELDSGLRLKANYETTPPVRSDCRRHSARKLPLARWTCVEWHFDGATNEMQYWIDGEELADIHVIGRGAGPDSDCAHQEDLHGEWLAPPAFQSLYMGFERYDVSSNDQNLWIDDVVISPRRVTCPTGFPRT
jgi:hypothetical protein